MAQDTVNKDYALALEEAEMDGWCERKESGHRVPLDQQLLTAQDYANCFGELDALQKYAIQKAFERGYRSANRG